MAPHRRRPGPGVAGDASGLVTCMLHQALKLQRLPQDAWLQTAAEPSWQWHEALLDLQQRSLASANEAVIEMEMLWGSAHSILDRLRERRTCEDINEALVLRSKLSRQAELWEQRYDALRRLPRTPKTDNAYDAGMDVRRMVLGVLLRVNLGRADALPDETAWDAFHADYAKMIYVAESGLRTTAAAPRKTDDKPVFRMFLLKALQLICKVCRHPMLRRRAVKAMEIILLDMYSVMKRVKLTTEQLGHLNLGLSIVYKVIALEEGAWKECRETPGCVRGSFVCNRHRVYDIQTDESMMPILTLRTVGDVLAGAPGQTSPALVGLAKIWCVSPEERELSM